MTSPISIEQVRAAVTAVVGYPVVEVRRLPGSVANQDFVVRSLQGPTLVLKAGPRAEIAAETWACRRLTELGVPVPEVIDFDLDDTGLGLPFVMLSFVEGGPNDHPRVARDAGRWFRDVHAQHVSGWGPIVLDEDNMFEARGRHLSWREAVHAKLSGLSELVAAGVVDEVLADTARALVSVEELLGYQGPGVLLHHDLKPAHLFGVDDGHRPHLTAILDWGDASVGDPTADLARLSMSGPVVTDAFVDGYGVRLTADLADRLARYRILWNIGALSYEYRAGGDWFQVYRNHIREDIRRLVRT